MNSVEQYLRVNNLEIVGLPNPNPNKTEETLIEFEEEGSEKLNNFSISSNVLDKELNIKRASMKENELRMMLLKMPVVEIRHAKKIIQSI